METRTQTAVVLYRTEVNAPLLTTIASASNPGGALHAHGPVLHGVRGQEVAQTVVEVARSRGAQAMVWDGDEPHDTAGVHQLVTDVSAGLLVIEWQPRMVAGHLDLARQILDEPPCDVLVVRPGSITRIEEITVAVGPGPNAPLVAELARRWSDAFGVPARCVRGVDDPSEVAEAQALCAQVAPGLPAEVPVGRDVVNVLVDCADRSGFLALGASKGVPLDRVGIRTIGTRLAQRPDATIVVGRRPPPPDQATRV